MTSCYKRLVACWLAFGCLFGSAALAEPLARSAVPDPLKSWIPWVLHGHEALACPQAYNSDGDNPADRTCVWPSRLELNVSTKGAAFRLEVQVFGTAARISLPGEPGKWPQSVKSDNAVLAVSSSADRPTALLAAGNHVVTGIVPWTQVPEDIMLPRNVGSLQLTIDGHAVARSADDEGRLWLQSSKDQEQASDALTVHTARLIDDDIPLRVTTRLDLVVSGKAREVQVPMALLPGFAVESLNSQLPARLQEDGLLRLQVRPGNWTVELTGHRMAATASLALPQGLAEEIWSFQAHNDLRVVNVQGLSAVDPKQVPMPDAWRSHPAYQIKPGQSLQLVESRRGNPNPVADALTLQRQIWLDFDGNGYTMQDKFLGSLSRSWRLEMAPPAVLGRVAVDNADQPVTRRANAAGDGVEMRLGQLDAMTADSRLEGNNRSLPASGWLVDVNKASAELNLPPGWQLLHASGVDKAQGSWLDRWTLWDFFVVLLATLAAGKVLGRKAAVLLGLALVASAHMPQAPRDIWLVLLASLALTRVLQTGRLLSVATWASRLCTAALALMLLSHGIEQIRLSIHPALEVDSLNDEGLTMFSTPPFQQYRLGRVKTKLEAVVVQEAIVPPPAAAPEPPRVQAPPPPPAKMAAPKTALAAEVDKSVRSQSQKMAEPMGNVQPRQSYDALRDIDPNAKVQTGPGLPTWQWHTYPLQWQGPVLATQTMRLFLLPPLATAALRLVGLALLLLSFYQAVRALPAWRRADSHAPSTVPTALAALASASVLAALLSCLPTEIRATALAGDSMS